MSLPLSPYEIPSFLASQLTFTQGPSINISPLPAPHPPTVFLFGGKLVQSRRLSSAMWALGLTTRTWTHIDAGEGPRPRYFHSMDICASLEMGRDELMKCRGGQARMLWGDVRLGSNVGAQRHLVLRLSLSPVASSSFTWPSTRDDWHIHRAGPDPDAVRKIRSYQRSVEGEARGVGRSALRQFVSCVDCLMLMG